VPIRNASFEKHVILKSFLNCLYQHNKISQEVTAKEHIVEQLQAQIKLENVSLSAERERINTAVSHTKLLELHLYYADFSLSHIPSMMVKLVSDYSKYSDRFRAKAAAMSHTLVANNFWVEETKHLAADNESERQKLKVLIKSRRLFGINEEKRLREALEIEESKLAYLETCVTSILNEQASACGSRQQKTIPVSAKDDRASLPFVRVRPPQENQNREFRGLSNQSVMRPQSPVRCTKSRKSFKPPDPVGNNSHTGTGPGPVNYQHHAQETADPFADWNARSEDDMYETGNNCIPESESAYSASDTVGEIFEVTKRLTVTEVHKIKTTLNIKMLINNYPNDTILTQF
jgi:hypothetical protein